MKPKHLLLGDEAFALGAINAGLSGAYAYPGTPSTEIMEFVQSNQVAKNAAYTGAGPAMKRQRWKRP